MAGSGKGWGSFRGHGGMDVQMSAKRLLALDSQRPALKGRPSKVQGWFGG